MTKEIKLKDLILYPIGFIIIIIFGISIYIAAVIMFLWRVLVSQPLTLLKDIFGSGNNA